MWICFARALRQNALYKQIECRWSLDIDLLYSGRVFVYGGVNVNNVRETNFQRAVTMNDLLFGKHLLLRKGKKNYVVVTTK